MRLTIYNALVNRIPGIRYRYHRFHDGSTGIKTIISWLYLLWLNFAYYCLFCRFLGKIPNAEYYETKKVPVNASESELAIREFGYDVNSLVEKLSAYSVISFDIFGTLIFRPFSDPTDMFFILGERFGILGFKNKRILAEHRAREKKYKKDKHYEVTLREIWDELSAITSINPEEGMEIETEAELSLCYPNPFMLKVWNGLKAKGKKLIIVSDMYLPEKTIKQLLEKNGFEGAEKFYVSNEYNINKYEGRIYKKVLDDLGGKEKLIHVGDDQRSDVLMAEKAGIDVVHYPQTGRYDLLYRPHDMSSIIGSAYRGIVNNHIYNCLERYSMEYEYGFIYGGLFVLGYCRFIHEQYVKENLDKLLFLSRDGDILKQVYDFLFPEDRTEYALWSRKASAKLMAAYDTEDYLRRFVTHRIGENISIGEALDSMELASLKGELSGWRSADEEATLKAGDKLNIKTAVVLKEFLLQRKEKIVRAYGEQSASAEKYYSEMLDGCKKAAAVDIGWAGSGAVSLSYLVERVWNIPCTVSGIIAGTNTSHNAEPDASESFLQSGKLKSYMFSQSHNRDLLKKHDPGKGYNIFWELLLSSPQAKFSGFYSDGSHFEDSDIDLVKAEEIQKGILDFVKEYTEKFAKTPYLLDISGRDAYAPVMAASGNGEKYLNSIKNLFSLDEGIC
ncbi:MAG: HAD-IA family hydrolase [Lachnospiraceae bacterium]|nr:HAD-IA family hydrolase [Lachnospiraceae bacterium]